MAIDTSIPRTRRALLAGGLGGLAALVAAALGRPLEARAVDGQTVKVGQTHTATSTTALTNADNGQTVFLAQTKTGAAIEGIATTSGTGVSGTSVDAWGVYGHSIHEAGVAGHSNEAIGVFGYTETGIGVGATSASATKPASSGHSFGSGTGVQGSTGPGPRPAASAKTGVYGVATLDASSYGVRGRSTAGRGVYGHATSGQGVRGYSSHGTGVYAITDHGYAIRSSGRFRADQISGTTTIAAGTSTKDVVVGVDVTSSSFVLLTPRGNLGGRSLWYTLDTTNDRITVKVSSAVGADLKVGWLLMG